LFVVLHEVTHETVDHRAPFLGARTAFSTKGMSGKVDLPGLARQLVELGRAIARPADPPTSRPPSYRTKLIGRDGDLRAVEALLANHHIVTIRGDPGLGKTRLAAALFDRLGPGYLDGPLWVALAKVADADALLTTLADALDIHDRERLNTEQRIRDALVWADRLIVLDNAEHLAGPISRLGWLFSDLDGVRVLATSQADLGLLDEQPYALQPLPVHEPGTNISPAVELFLVRARRAKPDFSASNSDLAMITQICDLRGGHPFAILLDAARAHVLSIEQILRSAQERPPEIDEWDGLDGAERSLRSSVGDSYRLQPTDSQRLLRQIASFESAASLRLISSLAAEAKPTPQILGPLVEFGLVRAVKLPFEPDNRYEMLEPIRQIVLAHLTTDDDRRLTEEARLTYARLLAKETLPKLGKAEAIRWMATLEAEHSSFRAALRWALTHDRPLEALELAVELFQFWNLHGYLREGLGWLEQTLEAAGPDVPSELRARALNRIASFLRLLGAEERAKDLYHSAIALADETDDPWNNAFAHNGLGLIALDQGDFKAAGEAFNTSLRVRRERLPGGAAVVLTNLGDLALFAHDGISEARARHQEALAIRLVLGDLAGIPISQFKLAQLDCLDGHLSDAGANLRDAVVRLREINDGKLIPSVCEIAADLAIRLGKGTDAVRLIRVANELRDRYGVRRRKWEQLVVDRLTSATAGFDTLDARQVAEAANRVTASAALDFVLDMAQAAIAASEI
jgi:predicted ATPase